MRLQFSVFTGSWGKSIVLAVFVVILGFIFSAVAAYMAGLVGSSNNPVSGVTISTVLIISLVIRGMFGTDSEVGAPVAVLVGNIVCSAASISGNNMQDLKSGHLLGSTPWKQQVMQLGGVTISALVMAPTLEVLRVAYGFGNGDGQLAAPQAVLVADVSNGVISGGLPWSYIGVGIAIGAFIICLDLFLESKKSSFRVPVLGFAVGFYLPMEVGSSIFVGSLVPLFLGIEDTEAASPGLMYCAGIITGAGLTGIIIAFIIVIYGLIADPPSDESNPLLVYTHVDEATNTVYFVLCPCLIRTKRPMNCVSSFILIILVFMYCCTGFQSDAACTIAGRHGEIRVD
jgi:putative OPT family oligopeptide transporter